MHFNWTQLQVRVHFYELTCLLTLYVFTIYGSFLTFRSHITYHCIEEFKLINGFFRSTLEWYLLCSLFAVEGKVQRLKFVSRLPVCLTHQEKGRELPNCMPGSVLERRDTRCFSTCVQLQVLSIQENEALKPPWSHHNFTCWRSLYSWDLHLTSDQVLCHGFHAWTVVECAKANTVVMLPVGLYCIDRMGKECLVKACNRNRSGKQKPWLASSMFSSALTVDPQTF